MGWIIRARGRARMNVTPPEASSEYSTAPEPSRGDFPLGIVLAFGTLLAALMLIVAELTALYIEHVPGLPGSRSHSTGSHNGFSLVPLAIAAVRLGIGFW